MPAERKTIDEYDIEGRYEGGWEVVTTELTITQARRARREYRQNEPGTDFQIRKRRLRKDKLDPEYVRAHEEGLAAELEGERAEQRARREKRRAARQEGVT